MISHCDTYYDVSTDPDVEGLILVGAEDALPVDEPDRADPPRRNLGLESIGCS